MMDRFYVDVRVGCVAIRDREVQTETIFPGKDVVWCKNGKRVKKRVCATCGRSEESWAVPGRIISEAKTLCAKLNAGQDHVNP